MAARKRKLEIEITDTRKGDGFRAAGRDVDAFDRKLTKGTTSWGQKLGSFSKTAAVGLAGLTVAAVAVGTSLVSAAEESQKVTAQTEAVIASMGGVANVTAGQVADLSEKLSLKSGIDDELIQSGQNVLLTFGQIRNEVGKGNAIFDRATTAALDMSVALGTDMQSAVTQIGKALNDPIAGLTSLTRAGVQFTDQQKAQIAAMVEAGDVVGAQKIILAELETQFGGSAEAQATASGKLSTAWGNLQETLGEKLLPVVERFSEWATTTGIPALESLFEWVERNRVVLLVVAAVFGGILIAALVAFVASLSGVTLAIIGIATAAGLVAAFVVTHFNTIRNAFMAVFNWVKANWPLLLAILTGPIGLATLAIVRNWGTIKSGVTAVKDWIVARFNDVVNFVKGLPGAISAAASGMWDGIKSAFKSAINGIIGLWNGLSFPSVTIGGQDPLGSFGPSLPEVTIGGWELPNIPLLAEGGIVTSPTFAFLGESGPEAVIPLGAGGVGTTIINNVDVHNQGSVLSERQLIKVITTELDRGGMRGFR